MKNLVYKSYKENIVVFNGTSAFVIPKVFVIPNDELIVSEHMVLGHFDNIDDAQDFADIKNEEMLDKI